jgi:hypothetical protein
MSGVHVEKESWNGEPFIRRRGGDDTSQTTQVFLYGPSIDAGAVPSEDLGTGIETYSLSNSYLSFQLSGEFDIGLHDRAWKGSGHHNVINAKLFQPIVGLKIGSMDDPQTCDRGVYNVQVGRASKAACWVSKGKWNDLDVVPENYRPDAATPTYGYYIPDNGTDNGSNIVRRLEAWAHRAGEYAVYSPSWRTKIDLRSYHSSKSMASSAVAMPPAQIDWTTYKTFDVDFHSTAPDAFDTTVPEGGTIGAEAFQRPDRWQASGWRLRAGNDGERTSIQTYGNLGRFGEGLIAFANVKPGGGEYVLRTGLWHDEETYAMFVADTSRGQNYRAVVRSPEGVHVDEDLGLAVGEQRTWESLVLNAGQYYPEGSDPVERQTWFVHTDDALTTNVPTKEHFERPLRTRIDIAAPDGSSNQPHVDLSSFQAGGFTGI